VFHTATSKVHFKIVHFIVDIIDLFHDLTKFIQKRGESNFVNNENQSGHQSDKVYYTMKGWSLVGMINKFHKKNLKFFIQVFFYVVIFVHLKCYQHQVSNNLLMMLVVMLIHIFERQHLKVYCHQKMRE
jgi:hypothetical protein